jgi:predicted PurR-regulated permease PerM
MSQARDNAEDGHHDAVGQPHEEDEGPVAEAEARAARMRSDDEPLGRPGRPLNRRSPFYIGMTATAGVAVTYALAQAVVATRDALVLIGVAFFLAVGLEPLTSWLVRHRFPRWAAVASVLVTVLLVVAGFLTVVITPLVDQSTQFLSRSPELLRSLEDNSSVLGQLNTRFHLQDRVEQFVQDRQADLFNGLLGAGRMVFSAVTSTLVVLTLMAYFLAELPRIRQVLYRLVPHSRRPRAILIGDEIFAKIGGYVIGNLLVSVVAGVTTFVWLLVWDVPYAVLLAIVVAVLDLIPAVGSTIAGVAVSLVALTVSLPAAIATAVFFVLYQAVENYLVVPRVMGRVVQIPDLVTVVAVLVGGSLLGVVGALVSIPLAAALLLVFRAVVAPRLDAM